jgi:phosphatidylethanolamine-binding protein (PEBP) family uncharacterized protein
MFHYSSQETRVVYDEGKKRKHITRRVNIRNGKGYKEVIVKDKKGTHKSRKYLNVHELERIRNRQFIPQFFVENMNHITEKRTKKDVKKYKTKKQRGGGLPEPTPTLAAAPEPVVPSDPAAPPPEGSTLVFGPTMPDKLNLLMKSASYTGSKLMDEVAFADISGTKAVPVITWKQQPGETLLLVWDPDAPSENPMASFVHYLVKDIKGGEPSTGTEVLQWTPPTPPAGSGTHKYFVGIFSQKQPFVGSFTEDQRVGFLLSKFIEENQLTLLDWTGIKVKAQEAAKLPGAVNA